MRAGETVAGRYRIEAPLGEGGLGQAYRAYDRLLGIEIALKVVGRDPEATRLLQREFLALRSARHPRLGRVYDFGFFRASPSAPPRAFYTSALVHGSELTVWSKGRTFEQIVPCLGDALSALAALHARGLLHGDVHPGNVLVDEAGRGVLIDLSCCRSLRDSDVSEISGTPGFVAPEALLGRISQAADLFAFGKMVHAIERGLRGGVPPRVLDTVALLVDADPARRPASAQDAAEALSLPFDAPRASDKLGGSLVGRAEAIGDLRRMIEALMGGAPGERVAALRGVDGVGRTRVLEELTREAQLRGDAALVPGRKRGSLLAALEIAVGEPVAPSKTAVLSAASRIAARRHPFLLAVDDAHEMAADESELLGVLLRALPSEGRLGVVVASRSRVPARTIELAPLTEADVTAWTAGEVPRRALSEIVRATGGYPKEIATLIAQLDGGSWDSRTLERAMEAAGTRRGPIDLGWLASEPKRALALVVASSSSESFAAAEIAGTSILDDLARRGLIVRDGDGERLVRRSDHARLAASLGPDEMKAAHEALALRGARLLSSEPERDDVRAAWITHLAAFDPAAAARAFVDAPKNVSAVALRAAADVLASDAPVTALVRAAEIYAASGEPNRALAILARCLRSAEPSLRTRLRRTAGQCYAQRGDSRRAIGVLRRALPASADPEVAAALSLAHLKLGDDREAIAVARAALERGNLDGPVRIDLLLDAAFAESRLGATTAARELVALARSAIDAATSPRHRFRVASATAFVEYRAGHVAAATSAYKEALDRAEADGLDDLVASAALNYGTACHQQGDLGRALEAYGRGRVLASALGMPTTEATLAFDLAKALADIGSHDRAGREASVARRLASEAKMPLLEGGACALLAELATSAGDHETASRLLDEASRLFEGAGDREWVELSAQRARASLARGDVAAANASLDATEARVGATLAPDAESSFLAARADIATAEGRTRDALELLERALVLARESGRRMLVAELEARSAEACAGSGSAYLAAAHASRARELWERTLTTLPPELQPAFRKHPARAAMLAEPRDEAPRPAESPVDVHRILEINRRLVLATTTTEVLEATLDAAIGLANAERGFVLLADPLRVAVARNVDRENLRKGHLKFSRTVAERVVRTGEPVLAVDAGLDPRFTRAASVHALRLKSLVCVPIRAPGGTLGAIYVDHRFSERAFRPELTELLIAFADQAALALVKSRLLEALETKTRELEERNREIEQLAQGQAVEIARLRRSSEDETSAEVRFDYGGLVATSPPMRRVLAVLDRVIDTDVTVLVRGESGTGKERIGRAIHANSTRSRGPFVAINCGALPESLLEAELFGYRKGAFSGANKDHPGLFVAARGGTLFLDELGEMSSAMQVKLLRVLQEREVQPLGATEPVKTDVRLVCATNRVLAEEVRAGRFREDLYYRVAVMEVELPPLRDRIEDVLPLVDVILARLATELGRPRATLDRSAERALLAHVWPGNVRELENVLTKAFLLAPRTVLSSVDLALDQGTALPGRKKAALRTRILTALEETDWNVVAAARLLGTPRATLYRQLDRLGIERPSR